MEAETQREPIEIGSVAKLDLCPGDRVVVNVEVSMMPPSKVRDHIDRLHDDLKRFFPKDVKVLVIPMRDGKPTAELTVIKGHFFGDK